MLRLSLFLANGAGTVAHSATCFKSSIERHTSTELPSRAKPTGDPPFVATPTATMLATSPPESTPIDGVPPSRGGRLRCAPFPLHRTRTMFRSSASTGAAPKRPRKKTGNILTPLLHNAIHRDAISFFLDAKWASGRSERTISEYRKNLDFIQQSCGHRHLRRPGAPDRCDKNGIKLNYREKSPTGLCTASQDYAPRFVHSDNVGRGRVPVWFRGCRTTRIWVILPGGFELLMRLR